MAKDDAPARKSDAEWLEILRNSPNRPNSAKLLGSVITAIDQETGRVEATFEGKAEFCNPMGTIQGGYLTAMLDEVTAVCAFLMSGGKSIVSLEIKVSFLAAAKPGRLQGVGEMVKLGRSTAFMEGTLYDKAGVQIARMSTTAKVSPSTRSAGL